ncbi:MAG TPA: hypothetical protein VKT78_10340 [Fimbriimonadaceae bacterium]|nr:hypothetical protein [Fimbriimonadaceae bacterium]
MSTLSKLDETLIALGHLVYIMTVGDENPSPEQVDRVSRPRLKVLQCLA